MNAEGGNGSKHPPISLIITLVDADARKIQVSGPLQDRFLCYAMLEMTRELLFQKASKAQESKIVRPITGLRLG